MKSVGFLLLGAVLGLAASLFVYTWWEESVGSDAFPAEMGKAESQILLARLGVGGPGGGETLAVYRMEKASTRTCFGADLSREFSGWGEVLQREGFDESACLRATTEGPGSRLVTATKGNLFAVLSTY
ncbi:MAG: hypothetical protein KF842_13460 [Caulobacter sp.]|nr:hypothetical protein [Caulobacter sp.]